MKDNEVKEKLESLSPLAGGVVFGKEEAWDKLQGRLERKPARKFPVRRLSAAAILLLFVALTSYYYLQQPAITEPIVQPTAAVPATTVPEQPLFAVSSPESPVSLTPETARIVHTIEPMEKEIDPGTAKDEVEPALPPTAVITQDPQPVTVVEATKQPVPVHKMRVVHINDLGKEEKETEHAYVYNGPALDIAKMKVVSLNDVQREESMRRQEEEVITIVRINKPHGVFLGFTNTMGWGGSSQRPYAQNPLSIRLNRNN